MERKKWKNKTFLKALQCSLSGIKYTFQNERNLRIQALFAILAILIGVFLCFTYFEFAVLFITIGMVFLAELVNTAIEVMLDLYSQEENQTIKIAKDIASGAVLITSIVAIMVGCVLFLPKL